MARRKKFTVCPLGGVGVAGVLKFWICFHLLGGAKRFGELQRLIPQASRQMLTRQLRELEQVGMIRRQVYDQVPPKVEYSLTDVGRQSEELVYQFYAWAQWCAAAMGLEYDDWLRIQSGVWMVWIWYHLLGGAKRYSDLRRLLPQANEQTLAARLREMERLGVIHRAPLQEGTSKVAYSLTTMGRTAEPILRARYAWGRWFCERVGLEFDWPVGAEVNDMMVNHLYLSDT
jgi:DNA-binding HxlR family transcriptional regulator